MHHTPTAKAALIFLSVITFASCKTITPGEVGFIVKKGKIQPGIFTQGRYHYNPFTSKFRVFSTRISEFSTTMNPPSKEGLDVKMDIAVLYHIKPEAAPNIYATLGTDYGRKIVVNNYMAIVREHTMRYPALELLNEREEMEKSIENKLRDAISPYGIVLDDVLVKDIDMPASVLLTIENKAKAEQEAKQATLQLKTKREQADFEIQSKEKELKFAIEKQRSDSLSMQIEANAVKNYQNTINQSLTDKILKYKSIDVMKELVKSQNTKVIITDGKTMMLNNIGDK